MKKILTMALALTVWAGAIAVPVRPRTTTVTQSDGTTLTITKIGDEWQHSTITTDGNAVARANDGNFYYIAANGKLSNVMAHDAAFRTASEQAFLQRLNGVSTTSKKTKMRAKAKAKRNDGKRRASQVPHTASPRVPIVLVQFNDIKFSKSDSQIKSYYETQMNEKGGVSCYQYFVDQSEGQYTPQFDILGPVTIKNRATYGANDNYGNDVDLASFVKDAVEKLPNVDWSLYDNNKDGEVDVIVLQYAGVGEASSYEDESIWPCQWAVTEATTEWEYDEYEQEWVVSKAGTPITVGEYTIDKFAVFNEMNGLYDDDPGDIDGVGTFCHEFSHCLGLPDFYDVEYSGNFGMGNWSCLDGGCNNNYGYTPCAYTAYEKEFMGWKQMEEAVPGTSYALDAAVLTTGKGIKITSDNDPNEYYFVENRQLTGWDAYLPNHGLLITHVYYDADAWENNSVNSTSIRRMQIIPADNSLKMNRNGSGQDVYYLADEADQEHDIYPYQKNSSTLINELTDNSTPAASLYTGGYMGKPITNIEDKNGIASFDFMKGIIAAPVLEEASEITATSFLATWSAVDDAESYTLRVIYQDPDAATLLLTEDMSGLEGKNGTDYGTTLDQLLTNLGWTGEKLFVENNLGLRMGTGKADGKLVSPSLSAGDKGKVTVVISAMAYNNGNSSDSGVTIGVATSKGSQTVNITSSLQQHVVVLDAAESDKVTFTSVKGKRPVISNIDIYAGDASGQLDGSVDEGNTLLFEGIQATSYKVTGLTAGATYAFDVKAILADNQSKFSNRQTVTLLADSGNKFDLNNDGSVNVGDVGTLYQAILSSNTDSKFDLNSDNSVNVGDVASLYEYLLHAD